MQRFRLPHLLLAMLISAATSVSAVAQATQGGPPPHGPEGGPMHMMPGMRHGMGPAPHMQLVKAAYLGVEVGPANPDLRSQLRLPEGVGLVVQFIDADSPASKAGLQTHDVLQKLDDQLLVNPPQFLTLIRLHKPGDSVHLDIIREGKPQAITATLVEKEVPPLETMHNRFGRPGFGPTGGMGGPWSPRSDAELFVPPPGFNFGNGYLTFADDQHVIQIRPRDGKPYLTATSKEDGKVIFEGPVSTEQERQAVPESIRQKLTVLPGLMGGRNLPLGGIQPPQLPKGGDAPDHEPGDNPPPPPQGQNAG